MIEKKKIKQNLDEQRRIVYEMVDYSIELGQKIGNHRLTRGCNCITCIRNRKRIIKPKSKWNFSL